MPSCFEPLLSRALHALNSPAPPSALSQILAWLDLLHAWNQRIDLTAARNPEEFVDLAIADAAILASLVDPSLSVVDIGSGAGAPGLPLALLRPDLSLSLVEPLSKRVSFLRTVIGTLGIPTEIIRTRAEALPTQRRWNAAISRATLDPASWLDTAQHLVTPSGVVAVMLAKSDPPVSQAFSLVQQTTYQWPLTGSSRTLCLYRLLSTNG